MRTYSNITVALSQADLELYLKVRAAGVSSIEIFRAGLRACADKVKVSKEEGRK